MINRNLLIYIIFLFFSILYVILLFTRIPEGSFLFIGDQFFRFTKEETFANAFYLRKMMNLSVFNAWQLTVQTPDIIFYSIVYKLGFTLIQAEKILLGLILFITLSFSFLGFTKLSKLFINQNNVMVILAITLWYTVNPYMMVLWHGAVYNFGSSLTYALAPLIIYYFHLSITNYKAHRARIICALLLFTASFTFWMLAALCILLFLYTVAILIANRKLLGGILLNGIKLGAIYLPMAAMVIYPILHEHGNNKTDINGEFVPTFGNIQGGLLYQLLMWFSWGIYNRWTPRSIYPEIVSDFYSSPVYIGATVLIYLILGFLVYKRLQLVNWNKKDFLHNNYLFLIFFAIFFVAIFLAKGQEPPLGGIFLFLYENVPFFTVFRSSDHRFGFPAVLALSIALLILIKDFKHTKAFVIVFTLITFAQNFIFFSGDLLIGQNLEGKFVDRIVKISKPYQEVADYINAQGDTFYILPNPSIEYGTFNFDQNEKHMGQDLLPKLINKPFADVPVISGMHRQTGAVLYTIVDQDIPEMLPMLPIKYVLQRKDVECPDCISFTTEKLSNLTDKEYENETFTLYKVKNHTPLINSSANITYRVVNPVKYEVEIKNITSAAQLNFMESYNDNWKIFLSPYSEITCENPSQINERTVECPQSIPMISFSDASTTGNPELRGRIFPENFAHINSWNISAEAVSQQFNTDNYKLNEDGTYNIKLTIFYAPQSTYIYMIYISLISVVVSIIIVFLPASIIQKFRKE